MLRYMLDTNICIRVIKGVPATLAGRFDRLAAQLSISSITLAELHFGAEKSARRLDNLRAIEGFAARLQVLDFSAKASAHYGELRAELEDRGTPIGPYDLLIGAHARAEGLILVTSNIREFERLPGVQIEDWS